MNLDVITLAVAAALLLLAAWTAINTQSRAVRLALITIMIVVFALMAWNLATHGGLHAV